MNYETLFSPHNIALLGDWLAESGELYVDIGLPHSGASGTQYFVRSMSELKALIARQTWPEIGITIFRRMQYPLRGIADEDLLNQALARVPDGQWYHIVSLADYFPSPCAFIGSGKSHAELKQDWANILGSSIGFGQDPNDYHDAPWFYSHPNEFFLLSVTKNQNYYESFAKNPEGYKTVIDLWSL